MSEIITQANTSQAALIARLVNQAYRPASDTRGWTHEADLVAGDRTSAEQVALQISPRSPVLVALRNGDVIACVQIIHDGPDCWIGMLATLPSEQNAGLGKKMLSAAEAYAIDHFMPKRLMMSVLTSRPELLSFYQRRGYQPTGNVTEYPVDAGVGEPLISNLQVIELSKDPFVF